MNKACILLADDHAVVRSGICNALRGVPNLVVVDEVGDGPALFDALARLEPDCLLIDVAMPQFEPISAIRRIRASYPEMKILVISAYDDDVYVQGLLSAGVDGYHLKDQPLDDLRLAVQRILAGERWISSRLLDKLIKPGAPFAAASPLTARQRDLLRLLQEGLDNQTIARRMGLSVKTVENHLTRLYRQLKVQSRLEAVNFAMQHPQLLGLPDQPTGLAQVEAAPLPQGVTVLVVDDNVRYRGQLRRMVGKACPQAIIYEAENTRQALQLTDRLAPRLVLVDVVLGDEDGIRCTRRIKAQSPLSRVILISAYPDREFHRLGLEAGAVAFLDKKDLDTATLRQVVADVIV